MVIFCTENKQTRGGSRTPRSSMMEFFVTMEIISYWQSSSNLDEGGIIELPLYGIIFSFHDETGELPLSAIIFSFHDETGSMQDSKDPENSRISHTGTFFLSRCEEYNLLRNVYSLIDPFVFWCFCKVLFELIPLFWKYSNKL